MEPYPNAAAIAAAAAAARRRREREEEENMSSYSPQELADGWEFKIVRANTNAFARRETLEQVCREEAQSGWVLLEKFDDARLRFKRPASTPKVSPSGALDPYRTRYGIGGGAIAAIIIGSVVTVLVIVGTLVVMLR